MLLDQTKMGTKHATPAVTSGTQTTTSIGTATTVLITLLLCSSDTSTRPRFRPLAIACLQQERRVLNQVIVLDEVVQTREHAHAHVICHRHSSKGLMFRFHGRRVMLFDVSCNSLYVHLVLTHQQRICTVAAL